MLLAELPSVALERLDGVRQAVVALREDDGMGVVNKFPLQKPHIAPCDALFTNEAVYMRAYTVYAEVFGPQTAMIKDGCRGGFGVGEIVAFLYAGNFPKDQWRARVDEALRDTNL